MSRICVLVMSLDGPRYVPTNVIAPKSDELSNAPYIELKPTDFDRRLATNILHWSLQRFTPTPSDQEKIDCVSIANSVTAAARFLDEAVRDFCLADDPISDCALFLGRSVHIQVRGGTRLVQGWITGAFYEDSIEIVLSDHRGLFEKVIVPKAYLIEDGTYIP